MLCLEAGGVKDHNFLATLVNRNVIDIFRILKLNESILRGSKGVKGSRGGRGIWGGLQNFTGPLFRNINIFLVFGILKPV
jgi:hypothetical protein